MSNQAKQILTKKDVSEAGVRWMLMPVSVFNYETQLAPAVVFSLSKSLRKIYPDDDDYVKAINNHYKYFNSQPYVSALILGAALGVEEQEGIDGLDAVQNLKAGLMGPLAGIGDTIFWILLPTIFGGIAAYSALEGSYVGVIIVLLYSLAIFLVRVRFFSMGYKAGRRIISEFGSELNVFTEAASVLGLTVIGALVPSVISVTTPLTFKIGEISTSLQTTLDSILPGMLAVLLTYVAYTLLSKKKVKMTTIILFVLVISCVAYAFGILA